jgi:hypothetical protein
MGSHFGASAGRAEARRRSERGISWFSDRLQREAISQMPAFSRAPGLPVLRIEIADDDLSGMYQTLESASKCEVDFARALRAE